MVSLDSKALGTLLTLFSFLGFRGVRFSVHDSNLYIAMHYTIYGSSFSNRPHIFYLSKFRSMVDVVVKLTLLMCICLEQHVFLVKSITMLDRKDINIKQQILWGRTVLYNSLFKRN